MNNHSRQRKAILSSGLKTAVVCCSTLFLELSIIWCRCCTDTDTQKQVPHNGHSTSNDDASVSVSPSESTHGSKAANLDDEELVEL